MVMQFIMPNALWRYGGCGCGDFGGSVGGSYIEAAAAPAVAEGVLIMLII